jgi:hypothetical protein
MVVEASPGAAQSRRVPRHPMRLEAPHLVFLVPALWSSYGSSAIYQFSVPEAAIPA